MKRSRIAILVLALAICLSGTATASTMDTWGPNWYTPYDGHIEITYDYFYADNLKWNSTATSNYSSPLDDWELEVRPNNYHPYNMWPGGVIGFYGSMPGSYYEFDENDITIGSHSPDDFVTNQAYYATVDFSDTNVWQPSGGVGFNVESEYGNDLAGYGDAIPIRYEYFPTILNINGSYNW